MLLTHIVTPQEDGLTLHQLLRGPMALSARETRNAKARGAVTVDAAPFFSNQCIRTGMIVCVDLGSYEAQENLTAAAPVDVVYEDEAILAVHKPAMLQCHPSPSMPRGSDTLEQRVCAYLGAPAHPVHRLDSETTGVVLFAKVPYAQAHLQQQMQAGTFQKTYQAWVCGAPEPHEGIIDAPIAREHPDSFTRVIRSDGQRAVSRYTVLQTLHTRYGQALSLVSLSPVTGRTHQLRVHMTHIGCPLLGDTRYFTTPSRAASDALGIRSHQLAAVSVTFIHPVSGETMTLSHPPAFSFSKNSCL